MPGPPPLPGKTDGSLYVMKTQAHEGKVMTMRDVFAEINKSGSGTSSSRPGGFPGVILLNLVGDDALCTAKFSNPVRLHHLQRIHWVVEMEGI